MRALVLATMVMALAGVAAAPTASAACVEPADIRVNGWECAGAAYVAAFGVFRHALDVAELVLDQPCVLVDCPPFPFAGYVQV